MVSHKCCSSLSVQFSCSVVSDSFQPHGLQHTRLPLSITNLRSFLILIPIESVMPSNHLILCRLLLPSVFASIRVFSNESALCIRWPKNWNSYFSINPSKKYSGLISLKIDWFNLLAVQGTLSLLQHNRLKASILQHSASFMVQLSHPYMTTEKP